MSAPFLATKLFIPQLRSGAVHRPHLIGRLNEGLLPNRGFARNLTLISAPAGFGKTTLVAEWVAGLNKIEPRVRVAWLSLEEADSNPERFIAYLIAALQTIVSDLGARILASLQAPQPLPIEISLTALLNEIAAIPVDFVLVLDDYHLVDSQPVNQALTFLVEHLPPQMHLAIVTREDPPLPLARLRGRGQLTEVRAADLRFTPEEAAEFLNRVMALGLSAQDIAALENRTEGWIAGLQLAALALQRMPAQGAPPTVGVGDTTRFINSFTGGHRFVLDYLLEEVLEGQPEDIKTFLLRTSILDRMCGPLCDTVVYGEGAGRASGASGQATLEHLERANLFVVPLDNERRWYRYHHLFAELLRQRLQQWQPPALASSAGNEGPSGPAPSGAELHCRASQWYEDNGLQTEAFRHAAAAHDIERAERLIRGGGIPLHSLAAVTAIIDWLDSLPKTALDARPWLWVRSAMLALNAGQTTGVEEKLQAAEKVLQNADLDDTTRDLHGQIAAVRATVALARYQPEAMIIQSRRALEHLRPDNLPFRSRALRTLGYAYQLQGDRAAARQAYTEAIAIRQASGNIHLTVSAITGLGNVQESENQLYQAAESYRHSLQLLSDQGPPNADQEYIGLARVYYEWNDLDAAEWYGQQSLQLAQLYDPTIDRSVICEVLLARVKLARGDVASAAAMLAETTQSVREKHFVQRMPEVAAVQVLMLLRQDDVATAARLAQTHDLPISRARVLLAQGDPSAALALLSAHRQQAEAKGWQDERLKALILEAVAHQLCGKKDAAGQVVGEAVALAEPGGFIRAFVDEGEPMRCLLTDFRLRMEEQAHYASLGYLDKLLAAFRAPVAMPPRVTGPVAVLFDPLTQRELEILKLITQGLSNREIGARLFLALNTVKGHNRVIFDKLQVGRRTEAVARARELGLL